MTLLKFIGLSTFSHGGGRYEQGGVSLWHDMQPFVVAWWHFHVAGQNFKEILQHLNDFLTRWMWWLAIV